jgi:hypothetical protein
MFFIPFLIPSSPLSPPSQGEFDEGAYYVTSDVVNTLAPRPNFDKFIRLEYWGAHEAAFALAGWPKENLVLINPQLPVEIRSHRFAFYAPPGASDFDSSHYGEKVKRIFDALEAAAKWQAINVCHIPLFEGVSWIISPSEAIIWALKQGIYIAEDLQKAIGVYLIHAKKEKTRMNKVKNLSIMQYLLCDDYKGKPFAVLPLSKDSLFAKYGTGSPLRHPTAIAKAINEHLGEPGKRGKEQKRPPYIPRLITEIKQVDQEGRTRFHLPSLKIALETLMNIWIEKRGNGCLISGIDNCLVSFQDPILDGFLELRMVKLYLDDAPALIWRLALEHCDFIWHNLLPISSYPVTDYKFEARPWNVARKLI